MAKMKYQRYRVYPPYSARLRARSFDYFKNAIAFAEKAFVAQGLDMTPVSISTGSGSDYRIVGHFGPNGWKDK